MIVNFPSPPNGNINGGFMAQVLNALRIALLPVISKNEAVSRVLLQAPNGSVYAVTVGNTGTLTTALIDGKTRDI